MRKLRLQKCYQLSQAQFVNNLLQIPCVRLTDLLGAPTGTLPFLMTSEPPQYGFYHLLEPAYHHSAHSAQMEPPPPGSFLGCLPALPLL